MLSELHTIYPFYLLIVTLSLDVPYSATLEGISVILGVMSDKLSATLIAGSLLSIADALIPVILDNFRIYNLVRNGFIPYK